MATQQPNYGLNQRTNLPQKDLTVSQQFNQSIASEKSTSTNVARFVTAFQEQNLNLANSNRESVGTFKNNNPYIMNHEKSNERFNTSMISNTLHDSLTETPCISVIKHYRDQIFDNNRQSQENIGGHLIHNASLLTDLRMYQTPQRYENYDEYNFLGTSPFIRKGFDEKQIPSILQRKQQTQNTSTKKFDEVKQQIAVSQIDQKKSLINSSAAKKENIQYGHVELQNNSQSASTLLRPQQSAKTTNEQSPSKIAKTFHGYKSNSPVNLQLHPIVVFEEDSDSFVESKLVHDQSHQISDYKNERRSNERISIAMQQNLARMQMEGELHKSLTQQSSTETIQTAKSSERRYRAQRQQNAGKITRLNQSQGAPQNSASRASLHQERRLQQRDFQDALQEKQEKSLTRKSQSRPQKQSPQNPHQKSLKSEQFSKLQSPQKISPTKVLKRNPVYQVIKGEVSLSKGVPLSVSPSPEKQLNVSSPIPQDTIKMTGVQTATSYQNQQIKFSFSPSVCRIRAENIQSLATPLKNDSSTNKNTVDKELQDRNTTQAGKNRLKQKNEMARKIQMAYKKYRNHKQELILCRVVKKAIIMIQRAYRKHMIVKGLKWRQHIKNLLSSVIEAWRTRKSLNCLGQEVQQFVNCDNPVLKLQLRAQFHSMHEIVLKDKLYLSKNIYKMKQMQKKSGSYMTSSLTSPAMITLIQNKTQNKETKFQESPIKQQSPVLKDTKSQSVQKKPELQVQQSPINQKGQQKKLSFRELQETITIKNSSNIREASKTSHRDSINNQNQSTTTDLMNYDLKPRVSKTIPTVHQPSRPELSNDSHMVSPNPTGRQVKIKSLHSPQRLNQSPPKSSLKCLKKDNKLKSVDCDHTQSPQTEVIKPSLKNYLTKPSTKKQNDTCDSQEVRPERSISREGSRSRQKLGPGESGYKKKIQSVKHRVDCWNKSGSKYDETNAPPLRRTLCFEDPKPFPNQTEKMEIGMTEYIQIPLKKRSQALNDFNIRPVKQSVNETSTITNSSRTKSQMMMQSNKTVTELAKRYSTKQEDKQQSPARGKKINEDLQALHQRSISESRLLGKNRHSSAAAQPTTFKSLQELMAKMQNLAQECQRRQSPLKAEQQRAYVKYLTQSTREFKQLVRSLEDQFDTFKSQIQE